MAGDVLESRGVRLGVVIGESSIIESKNAQAGVSMAL